MPEPSVTTIDHTVIRTPAEITAVEADWNKLLADSPNACLSLTPGWARAWWQAYNDGCEFALHCFWSGGRMIALAPTMREKTRLRGIPVSRWKSMANGSTPVWDLLHCKDLHDESILQVLDTLIAFEVADLFCMRRLPVASKFRSILLNSKKTQYRVGQTASYATPMIRTSVDWDTYFAGLSRNFRRNMKKRDRDFDKHDTAVVEMVRICAPEDPVFAEIVEVSRNSWKAKDGKDLYNSPERRRLLETLIRNFGPDGKVVAWLARLDSKLIAFEFHVEFAGVTYPLRADYDEAFSKYSPGSVLVYRAMRDYFVREDIHTYDTCADQYGYLTNWTDERREQCNIDVFPTKLKSVCLYNLEYALVPIGRKVKQMISGASRSHLRATSPPDAPTAGLQRK